MKKKLMSIMLATSMACMLLTGCGGSGNTSTPNTAEAEKTEETTENEAIETEQTEEAETPVAEEQVTETQEAATAETPAPEPEDDTVIPDGSEVTESELDDGTISTEIIKPDGSIRLILEDPDGGKTVTNYDSQLYPQSKVKYDENGSKVSESAFKYDENQLDTSWEYTTEYDESGNATYTSETESVYPVEEGFKYGAEPASGPEKVYPNPTGEGFKFGTELLPTTSETTVKDAQGKIVKTISVDNEECIAIVKYPDGSEEIHYVIPYIENDGTTKEGITIYYYEPGAVDQYKEVRKFQDGYRQEFEYNPDGSVKVVRKYDNDGNLVSEKWK